MNYRLSTDIEFTKLITPEVNGKPARLSAPGTILLDLIPEDAVNPSAYLPEGSLETAAIYWWRVRAIKIDNGQIERSPWSDPRSFTIKTVFIVGDYWGIVLISPENTSTGRSVDNISFSWSPWKNATKYQFDLAKDYKFKDIVVTTNPATNDYLYNGMLEYNTKYFWRVKTIEVDYHNIPSPWTAAFSFTTEQPPPPLPETPAPADYTLIWILLAISALLAVLIVVLITVRRKARHR